MRIEYLLATDEIESVEFGDEEIAAVEGGDLADGAAEERVGVIVAGDYVAGEERIGEGDVGAHEEARLSTGDETVVGGDREVTYLVGGGGDRGGGDVMEGELCGVVA